MHNYEFHKKVKIEWAISSVQTGTNMFVPYI